MMSKKVLVVDDDPDVRLFSVTVLEENGYTPLEAEDGESGLKMIKQEKPDLVILDILMPRQSGVLSPPKRYYINIWATIILKLSGYSLDKTPIFSYML